MPAPECRLRAVAGRAEAGAGRRAGPLGAGPPRAPPAGHAGLGRARGRPLARRPRHLFGRAGRAFRSLSRPAAGSRAPGPAALGRLRPPYLTSAGGSLSPLPEAGRPTTPNPRPSLPWPATARAGAASQGRPRPPRSSPGGGGRGGPGARSRRSLPPLAPPLPAARPGPRARLQRSRHPGVSES